MQSHVVREPYLECPIIDPYVAVFYASRKGLDRFSCRRRQVSPAVDTKICAVQRAFDTIALQISFRQGELAMRAAIAKR